MMDGQDNLGQIAALAARVRVLEAQVEAKELAELKLAMNCPLALSCLCCGKLMQPTDIAVRWRDSMIVVCFACRDARAAVVEAEAVTERFAKFIQSHIEVSWAGDNTCEIEREAVEWLKQRAVELKAQAQGTDTPTQGGPSE